MSRNLKRVPLNFDWPLKKTWEGYQNPYFKKCPKCDNGETAARKRLESLVNLIMLSGTDSLRGKNHPYFEGGFIFSEIIPSKDMVELTMGLAGRSPSGLGHDACDRWSATEKIIEAAGLDPKKWGICPHCKGDAIDPEIREKYEAWEEYAPPKGEGYQLWEDCSEGSPVSPVFGTLEELCEWAEDNATTFGSYKASKEEWIKMLKNDFVNHKEGNMVFM